MDCVSATQSITLDCTEHFGAILTGQANALLINTPGVNVVLRSLSIAGRAQSQSRQANGISFLAGESLNIDRVTIQDFRVTAGGFGLPLRPPTWRRGCMSSTA